MVKGLHSKKYKLFLFYVIIRVLFFHTPNSFAQTIDFGKSYINVTKGTSGGTVETGDILEIRASFVVRSGTYDSCRYRDLIPPGTTYIPGTIRVLTNEGKVYKQFTDVYGDDPGWITATTITIHLGFNTAAATAFRRGRVANTHKPSFYGSTCIMIASFRVTVTAITGALISTGAGTITYKNGLAAIQTYTFPNNVLAVYTNTGICSNAIGANALGTESNGTFGNGPTRNRGTSANVPVGYIYTGFTGANAPNDYAYAIANNTSTQFGYSTVNTWLKPDPDPDGAGPLTTHRVFSVWDIIGDHTGAASPTAGNPPADTVANNNAGHMLVINAAYRIDSAFQQVITGLCPNTSYEISCWMRNICSKCGCDSNGKGATNASGPPYYIPTAAADSSGVAPNLTFDINGVDYYTTGNLQYTGQWVRKGFTYRTGISETSITLKFFNNAPGGGGNDWALDDISIRTCAPNMSYAPTLNPNICDSNALQLADTIRSFYDNYTYYKWQRSIDGGATWVDVTSIQGPATPYWNGTAWEYVALYTVPNTQTYAVNDGDQYRVIVATLASNLSNASCYFTDGGNVITLNVLDCGPILSTQISTFSGIAEIDKNKLEWESTTVINHSTFDIEKSTDGYNFIFLTSLPNRDPNPETYTYHDADISAGKKYYRLTAKNQSGNIAFFKTIFIERKKGATFLYTVNPFLNELKFELIAEKNGFAIASLSDQNGRIVYHNKFSVKKGVNKIVENKIVNLANGIYYFSVYMDGFIERQKLIKHN